MFWLLNLFDLASGDQHICSENSWGAFKSLFAEREKAFEMLNESFVLGNVKRGFATRNYAFFVCLKRSFRV